MRDAHRICRLQSEIQHLLSFGLGVFLVCLGISCASWISQVSPLNSAHPPCQPPIDSIFTRSSNLRGFQNQSASFTDRETGSTGKRSDSFELLCKTTEEEKHEEAAASCRRRPLQKRLARTLQFGCCILSFRTRRHFNIKQGTEAAEDDEFFSVDDSLLCECFQRWLAASYG